MFRPFRVIIRPSNEPTQDYHSAHWNPVALTIGGVIVVYAPRDPRVHYELNSLGSVHWRT